MKLIESWWNFSRCWGGVGASLFWWTVVVLAAFVLAGVLFLRQKTLTRKPWVFLLAMVLSLAVHFFVLLVTWSQVYGTLYITSYHWSLGEQEENAFMMWQATVGLGALSSCLLAGALLLLKPGRSANQSFDGIVANRAEPSS